MRIAIPPAPPPAAADVDPTAARYRRRVEALVAFGHRGSATDHERRAADHLLNELRDTGANATIETFAGSRTLATRLLVHVLLAAAGVPAVARWPWLTAACAAVALASLVVEQMTWGVWLSRCLPRPTSCNVVGHFPARGGGGVPARRLVVCAHYDTQPAGWIWTIQRLGMPLFVRAPLWLKPPLLSLALLIIVQLAGVAVVVFLHPAPPLVRIPAAMLLAIYAGYAVVLAQWAMGQPVPGAVDNASGVAAALEIADAWSAAPPAADVELLILLPGCEESVLLGAAAWCRRHRDDLAATPTTVLNVDSTAFGPPRFLGAEVPAVGVPLRAPAPLIAACARVAARLNLTDPGPHALPGPTDAFAFLAHGVPTVSVVTFADGVRFPHYHTPDDTVVHMDFAAARRGTEFAKAVAWELATASPPPPPPPTPPL